MNSVQPIMDKELLEEIKKYFKESNERNYILFLLGIYTGLRISDILRLRVSDVQGWNIYIKEKKTKKINDIKMPAQLKKAIRNFTKNRPGYEYLIKSRNGKNRPITRGMAYVILQEMADHFELERIGCHSLRKTYGFHHYEQNKDIATLMEMFNHSDPSITLRYIGMRQKTRNEQQKKVNW